MHKDEALNPLDNAEVQYRRLEVDTHRTQDVERPCGRRHKRIAGQPSHGNCAEA